MYPMKSQGISVCCSYPYLEKCLLYVTLNCHWMESVSHQHRPQQVLQWRSSMQAIIQGWCLIMGTCRSIVDDGLVWNVKFLTNWKVCNSLHNPFLQLMLDDIIVLLDHPQPGKLSHKAVQTSETTCVVVW